MKAKDLFNFRFTKHILSAFRHFWFFSGVLILLNLTILDARGEVRTLKAEKPHLEQSALDAYKEKNYKKTISLLSSKEKKTFKDFALLALALEKTGKLDQKIKVLEEASKYFPEKDVLKRELASILERRANAFPKNSKTFDKPRKDYKDRAAKILFELYQSKFSPENFTALVDYYKRNEDYDEALALLELYSRQHPRGEIYYTYLCAAHFNLKYYNKAKMSCAALMKNFPENEKGTYYHAKSLEALGEKEKAQNLFLEKVSRFPASHEFQLDAAKTLIERGKISEGLEHIEKHIALGNASDEALHLKAQTLFEQAKFKDALEAYVLLCKQKEEPRKPLIKEMTSKSEKILDEELKKKFSLETKRCKYQYRPRRKVPRGYVGSRYQDK